MKTVLLSTEYCRSIRVKNKTLVIFLRKPDVIEISGAGVIGMPLKFENDKTEVVFNYTDEYIWDEIKKFKKLERKQNKVK